MAFVRTRIIKGRPYRYLEERWRENGRVRSRSTYLGAGTAPVPLGNAWDMTLADEALVVKFAEEKAAEAAPATTPSSSETAPPSDPGASAPEASPR